MKFSRSSKGLWWLVLRLKALAQAIRQRRGQRGREILEATNGQSRAGPRVYVAPPPPADSSLAAMKREILEAVRRHSPQEVAAPPLEAVGEEALVAFTSRYTIEREVRKLWAQTLGEEAPRRPLEGLVEALVLKQLLPLEIAAAIAKVSHVASPAVHAQPISEEKVAFLRQVVPELVAALQALQKDNRRAIPPRRRRPREGAGAGDHDQA